MFFSLSTFRPASTPPEVIATLAIFNGLFHFMHHRFSALGARFARGFGKGLQFFFKLGMGFAYTTARYSALPSAIRLRLFHSAGKFKVCKAELAAHGTAAFPPRAFADGKDGENLGQAEKTIGGDVGEHTNSFW